MKPLLEKGPPNLHAVLLARTTATLPLSRLLRQGQVLELTADDLRFTGEEVRQFLVAHQESCSAGELEQIVERTGGWVVALQLAMHSQRGHSSLAEHLRTLRGDSRWLAQYLTQEVLAQQSPDLRSFLLRTSILDSFSAPLCQAVAGVDDAYQALAELRAKELFLIQLDAEGAWFRYHHLFQELLQQRLLEVEGKAAVDHLHRQAAGWLAGQERLLPAIRHLQRAGDEDGAAALVESRIRPFILHYPTQAHQLFDALSPDAILRRPRLALERCLASLMVLNKDVAGHVRNAQRSLAEHAVADPQQATWEAELLVYRAAAHFMSGEIEEATALAQEAQSHSRHLDRLLEGMLEFLWLHLSVAANDETAARRHGRRALAAFQEAGLVVGLVAVRRELAKLEIRAGHSAAASRELEAIIADFGGNRAALNAELAWAHITLAEHRYWQDQLDLALRHIQAARELASTYQDDETNRGLRLPVALYALRAGQSCDRGGAGRQRRGPRGAVPHRRLADPLAAGLRPQRRSLAGGRGLSGQARRRPGQPGLPPGHSLPAGRRCAGRGPGRGAAPARPHAGARRRRPRSSPATGAAGAARVARAANRARTARRPRRWLRPRSWRP